MTSSSITTLIIARHGNTFGVGDIPTRVGARTDLPLVASGEEQAKRLGEYLHDHGYIPSIIYTSSLKRTISTAALAAQTMVRDIPQRALSFLNEIDYGPDENQAEDFVRERLGGDALEAWDKVGIMPDAWSPRPADIILAWKEFLNQMQTEYFGQTVMVVTSNGIARFALACTLNGGEFPLKLATGAYGIITCSDHKTWSVKDWNIRP